MSRSLKKGPFVETRLLSRVAAMNEAGKKEVIKTWSRSRPSSRRWLVTRSPSTMAASTSPCTSPSPWLVTSWASSPLLAPSVATSRLKEVLTNG